MVGILGIMAASSGILKLYLLDKHWISLLGSRSVDSPDWFLSTLPQHKFPSPKPEAYNPYELRIYWAHDNSD